MVYWMQRSKSSTMESTPLFSPTIKEVPQAIKQFEGKKIILYVGHFGPRKGLIFLIRAMQEIVREIPEAVAVGIGGVPSWLGKADYWSYLETEIRKRGLEKNVLLMDKVPNEQTSGILL